MKNITFGCLIGFGFFFLSACSNDKAMSNTTNENTATATKTVVVKSEFNFENLEKTEYIADTHNSRIGRYIDCTAGVTVYTHGTGISVITNAQISKDLIKEKCEQAKP